MRNSIKYIIWLVFTIGMLVNTSCKKQDDYLDKKRNNSDVAPTSLADYQAILDNDAIMNTAYPLLGLVGADNYYILNSVFPSQNAPIGTSYTWAPDIYQGLQSNNEWSFAYQKIECANVVLEGLGRIPYNDNNKVAYNNLKGSALFFRAFGFYNLAAIYCKPYSASTASSDLGIPLRLTSDVNVISTRATVKETYDKMIADLNEAATLLPITPLFKTRPSMVAAIAMLAKVYLSMEDYNNAKIYSDSALAKKSDLMDFNSSLVSTTAVVPFPANPANNPEIIFFATGSSAYPLVPLSSKSSADSFLYRSYNVNDIRQAAFYKPASSSSTNSVYQFKGTYDCYAASNFSGLATNEIYLIRSEANARQGNISAAMQDLNGLLRKRWKTGYVDLATTNQDTALVWVLRERRKELPYTGNIRWEDLRRLNKDPRFAITIYRNVSGVIYSLPPNDKKYVYPLPINEVQLSGLEQNPR